MAATAPTTKRARSAAAEGAGTVAAVRSSTQAMTTRFARVPNPGRSRSGHQASSTTQLIAAVDQPMEIVRVARETLGEDRPGRGAPVGLDEEALADAEERQSAERGASIRGRTPHVDVARHGVAGMRWLNFTV